MPEEKKIVMISSTAVDLPEHREQVMNACIRMGMFPVMMEHLAASDGNAAAKSLAMVDRADIYVGVLAFRYGYVPDSNNPEKISITEMEYNRAVERGVPRLIFFMDKLHPITAADMDEDTTDPVEVARRKVKLDELKKRAGKERVAAFFKSATDLRGHVIQALVEYHKPDLTAFHYVSEIPEPPEAFIAHPYTLLQTHRLVGRQAELNLLTDWVTKPGSDVYAAHIMNIVAIGGMGKSALTWKWFNDFAPQEMKPIAGRMWWSFYESDASFENFVTRALAYVTRRSLAEVEQIPAPDRESQLLAALDREPFLIVLDGFERILIAYARMDAARLDDSQVGVQRKLRKASDPRVGRFLKKLAHVKRSRVLVNSRLYPTELETDGGDPIPQCCKRDVPGLTDEEAVELWRAFGLTGSRDLLLPVFAPFGKHPLLIQVLAGEVKRSHRAPGNFEEWRKNDPRFDPSKFPRLQDAMVHVLEVALAGLDDNAKRVLETTVLFRMPAGYDTLAALFIGDGKPCARDADLDDVLTELEDRGLVGWDKRANRYDLHPIVRGVVWSGLGNDSRRGAYTNLQSHFDALPKIAWQEVGRLEDLTSAIELYNTLIGLGRYDDACDLFYARIGVAIQYRLSASRQQVELLEMLFPDGLDDLPRLLESSDRAFILNALATGYGLSGLLDQAATFLRRANKISEEINSDVDVAMGLSNLSVWLQLSGALHEAEVTACRAQIIACTRKDPDQQSISLQMLGLLRAMRGLARESASALQRCLRLDVKEFEDQAECLVNSSLAQRAVWFGEFAHARAYANRAWESAQVYNLERDLIQAARLQGEAALGLHDSIRDERLNYALTRARQVNYVQEELPGLIALAELRRQQGKPDEAREYVDDVWDSAERGPYPLFQSDAFNVLAQIEHDAGNLDKAIDAATEAYRLAWCDGPPFAYH